MLEVTVIEDVSSVIADEHAAKAAHCPGFQTPCPEVDVTTFITDLFGAVFKVSYFTDLLVGPCKYRQREIVGGTPGPWSGFLNFLPPSPHIERLNHAFGAHKTSNKAANSLWQYQIQFIWNGGLNTELYPNCGNSALQVQYADKFGVGGGDTVIEL